MTDRKRPMPPDDSVLGGSAFVEDVQNRDAFLASLGGEIGGNVCGTRWTCVCGDHGEAPSDTEAGLALYFHRRAKHT